MAETTTIRERVEPQPRTGRMSLLSGRPGYQFHAVEEGMGYDSELYESPFGGEGQRVKLAGRPYRVVDLDLEEDCLFEWYWVVGLERCEPDYWEAVDPSETDERACDECFDSTIDWDGPGYKPGPWWRGPDGCLLCPTCRAAEFDPVTLGC